MAKRNCRGRRNTRHHIRNKKDKGTDDDSNILLLDEKRHLAFHILFNHLNLLQAAKLLIRTARAKEAQNATH